MIQSQPVHNLSEAEALANCVVLQATPPEGTLFASKNTRYPILLGGLSFSTVRLIIAEQNALRLNGRSIGQWAFAVPDGQQPTGGQSYAVAVCRFSGEHTRWLPQHPLDLPPLARDSGLTVGHALDATRNANAETWRVTHHPLLWHVAALTLAVPVVAPAAAPEGPEEVNAIHSPQMAESLL